LIVVATIPAVVLGFLAEKFVRGLFGSPVIAASFLIVNGFLLLFGERLRGRGGAQRHLSTLSRMDAFSIGCWQCAALIPGISRSGATIVGALLLKTDMKSAAEFSFFLAIPPMVGAFALDGLVVLRPPVPASLNRHEHGETAGSGSVA